jgi:hypothetical protein
MFLENRQAKEVHVSLCLMGINISYREVSHLANRFLNHLENIHFANSALLRDALDQAGGYVAHIDATTEKGRGGIFAVLSGWDGWVLGCGKIETENHELITPFLAKTIDTFGVPVAFVRDLSKTLHKSIEEVVDCEAEKVHELICHFHLGKDVGKDILSADHDALLSLFRNANTRKKLQDFIKMTTNAIGKNEVRSPVINWVKNLNIAIPDGFEGISVLRSLAQHISDYNYDKSRQKFPFTRPYQVLYSRCLAVFAVLDEELTLGNITGLTKDFLIKLHCILWPVTSSEIFRTVSKNLQEKADIFDQFREAMRLDSKGGYISK